MIQIVPCKLAFITSHSIPKESKALIFFVGSMEAPSKAFLLFFLLPDWLKLNHLRSRMECGFSDIFRAIFVPP